MKKEEASFSVSNLKPGAGGGVKEIRVGWGTLYHDHYVTILKERSDIRPANYFLMPRGTDGNVCVIKAVSLIKLLDN